MRLYILFLALSWAAFMKGQSSSCSITNVVITPLVGNPQGYNISFSLTTSTPQNGNMMIFGNAGNNVSVSGTRAVNVGAGTHTLQTTLQATGTIPPGTSVTLTFSLGRPCNAQVAATFPAPVPECFFLTKTGMRCLPNNRLQVNYEIKNLPSNAANGVVSATINGGTFAATNPGTLAQNNTVANIPIGSSTSTLAFSLTLSPASNTATPVITFEVKTNAGQTLCGSLDRFLAYSSTCASGNRCDQFTINFGQAHYLQQGNFVTNFIVSPPAAAKTTTVTMSLVSVQRRTECPNSNPTPWETLTDAQLVTSGLGTTPPTTVSTPVPNSLQFNYGPAGRDASTGADHTISIRGIPRKANANCPERLRVVMRYIVRNTNGCEGEFYNIFETVY
ncbi:MAG: hypothetical protein RMJ33_14385 [Saprospiraceae bacterium]|nr:hypothetical protein [Saprospiraceae bacterium]MDW8231017.1 hypothetical protein [Saprospiraceae bacterium]